MPARAVEALHAATTELGEAAAAIETVELRETPQVATNAIRTMETTFTENHEILSTMDDPPLNLRELRGLNKAMQTVRGEPTNNIAEITELDEHIALEERKLEEARDDRESIERNSERLRSLQDEREASLEAASANREALRTQITRIRETITRVLHEDSTLGERLRTLFREQGVTIASIMTALGFIVSTLVLALTGGGAAAGTAVIVPTGKAGGIREWAKEMLKYLGLALTKLAGKARCSCISWNYWEHCLMAPRLLEQDGCVALRKYMGTARCRWWATVCCRSSEAAGLLSP